MITKQKRAKYRVDELLITKGYFSDILQAQKAIMLGFVRIGQDRVITKASESFSNNTIFNIQTPSQYVSRGALKILPAVEKYLPDLTGKTVMDIGASTGGFTDLMLQRGAKKVYAIDVGFGQLHFKLRNNPKIVLMENFNARNLDESSLPEKANVMTIDVSFISVIKILPTANKLLLPNSWAFILIKPQFEAKKSEIEQGGVVRSKEIQLSCVNKVVSFAENELNWKIIETAPSPILGPKGNQEYVLVAKTS